MTADEVINIIFETVEEMRPFFVPNPETRGKTSTGKMAFNALQVRVRTYQRKPAVEIFMDENIAPYVVYTNEPWISPKWRGKKNPNEGWWDKFLEELLKRVAKKINGNLTFTE